MLLALQSMCYHTGWEVKMLSSARAEGEKSRSRFAKCAAGFFILTEAITLGGK